MALSISPAENAIVDLDYAKAWATTNMEAGPDDDLLQGLVNTASDNFELELDLEVISRGVINEVHDIKTFNMWEIWLLQLPVYSFQTLKNDPGRDFTNPNADIPADERIVDLERGKVTRMGSGSAYPSIFTAGLGAVEAVYAAGFKSPITATPTTAPDVPDKIKGLVMETAASYYYHLQQHGFNTTSISDEQGNRTFMNFDFIPKHVKKAMFKLFPIHAGRITGRRVSVSVTP